MDLKRMKVSERKKTKDTNFQTLQNPDVKRYRIKVPNLNGILKS